VEENAGALAIELSAEEQEAIDALSAQVVGDRSDSADPDWTSDQRERAQRSPSR
jgi:diketogulonate reductase-like aldo/keto reductase